jgi:hypothetical protein
MTSTYYPPLTPGFGGQQSNIGATNQAQTRNPFFSISNQFLPRNLNDVIRWVRFITLHSPVTTEVLRKLATYPITEFTYSATDPSTVDRYKRLTKSFRLKSALHDIGFQYFTIGNVFISIHFPVTRTYTCPHCASAYGANSANFLKYRDFNLSGTCPKCGGSGTFIRNDTKSTNLNDMNLIVWDPLNITVNHNPITGKSQYYYKVPNDIKRRVLAGDRLLIDSIPWEFIEAIKDQKDFQFEDDYVFHLRNVDLGFSVNGVSIPPLISHYNLVFYQATLRKANESIATDFMAPMRVLFPQAQSGNSDPVTAISMRNFVSKMEEAMVKHKQDNNHVLIAPLPVGYQAISGEGKTLLVNQEIAQAEESLLLSLGVSRELLSGSTNWTSSTVGLRMLKNTLSSYVGQIQELLDWITTKVAAYQAWEPCEIGLTPFQLTDDDALKSVLMNLAQGGNVSMTTIYESLGRSYEDELVRIEKDAKMKAQSDVRIQFTVEQAKYLEGLAIAKQNTKDDSYQSALTECQQIAEQLINADPTTTRTVLNQLQVQDYAKWLMVSKLVEEGRTNQTHQVQSEMQQQALAQSTTPPPNIGEAGTTEVGGAPPDQSAAPAM